MSVMYIQTMGRIAALPHGAPVIGPAKNKPNALSSSLDSNIAQPTGQSSRSPNDRDRDFWAGSCPLTDGMLAGEGVVARQEGCEVRADTDGPDAGAAAACRGGGIAD